MSYPANWPHCPECGDFALDGHITCGRYQCNEGEARYKYNWVCAHCRHTNRGADIVYFCGNCGLPR